MAIYPAAIPTLDEIFKAINYRDWTNASKWNNLRAELRAALIELGTDPAGTFATVKARLDDIYPQFHDRGDPANADFVVGDLTTDGTWRDLDLSSIVPAGAKAVAISVIIQDNLTQQLFRLRKNGNVNVRNLVVVYTQVANLFLGIEAIVACDVNRVIEYYASNTAWTVITITIKGWWK